jgi:hypothetical protein
MTSRRSGALTGRPFPSLFVNQTYDRKDAQ